ncbi:MAG: Asp-tRNA(Asn)/Glu-tRNA(Gln) amidotransferase GatCAB subunit A, partial [Candidatus Portnoybacteria bacterium CG_4_10_14_0_2_um_filter_43_36]
DSTSVEYGDKEEMIDIKNLKIGVPKEYFVEGIDPETERIVKEAITRYEKLGAKITEVSLPHTQYAVPCYYIIVPAEASANLARYDGIRYGLSEQSKDLLSGYLKTRQRGFGDEVRRRIMVGTYVLSAGYYDAYYLKAQKVRTLIKRDFDSAFEKNDVLMTPVSPTPAFKIGEKTDNPLAMYLADIYTVSLNLAGVPGLSLPCGKTASEGLPVGLQIIGRHFDEEKIFQVAEIYRQSKNN